MTGVKNSLDFQLVSFLGLLIGEHKHLDIPNEYYIISRDQGFLSSINLIYGYAEKISIELIPSMSNICNVDSHNDDWLYDELKLMFKTKTINKISFALYGCNTLSEARTNLIKAFNFNPCVCNKIDFLLVKHYKDIATNAA